MLLFQFVFAIFISLLVVSVLLLSLPLYLAVGDVFAGGVVVSVRFRVVLSVVVGCCIC